MAPVVRAPDRRLRVFISSTLQELADERKAARDAITQLHLAPLPAEDGSQPHPSRDQSRADLEQSQIFIGIYWQQYGPVAPGETISALEDEYRLSGDKPRLIYIKTPAPDLEPPLHDFLERIKVSAPYRYFATATELRAMIENDLMLLLTQRFETPAAPSLPTGTVTFLYTDIEGSTGMAQQYPDAMPALLARHNAIMQQAVGAHRGYVFRFAGDSYSVAFYTARDALEAALDAQRLLTQEAWSPVPIKVRMGIHTGPAQLDSDGSSAGAVDSQGYTGYSTLARASRVMSAAHGCQVLLSNSSAEQTRSGGDLPQDVTLRDMGEHRLKGLLNPEHLWQVVAPDLPQSFPRLQTLSSVPSNLPMALNRFVGREREIQEVLTRLDQTRLLTLLGPGGTGKTRLALQASANLLDRFEDRVYFVDLAPSRDLDSALVTMARTVGLREKSDQPLLDDLKGQIGAQEMLLLLDNFEQVTVAAPTMAELLRDCPNLVQLVTSREALHVRGEMVYPVPPLTLPQSDLRHLSIDQLAQCEAIQLFVERAQAVRPNFQLTPENAQAVAELCLRLDGLPLAIELAAARLNLFTPRALVERLSDRLKLLRGGARDLPARQQTLRDTIDWSYEMLDPGEQRLFKLLSVFSGATFEAVEDVAAHTEGFDEIGIDILDGLGSLVDKSLVRQVDQPNGDSRFVMLETLREFAADSLDDDPDLSPAACRSHATYFADWTERQWELLTGDEREPASAQMETEIDNIRTAWRYWVEDGNLEQLGKLTHSLWLLYDMQGWYHDIVSLTKDLLHVLDSAPATPKHLVAQITLQTSLARALLAVEGYTPRVEAAYMRALQLSEEQGEIPRLLPVLRGLASFYLYRAKFEKGVRIGEQILGLAESQDDANMRVEGHLVIGSNLSSLDDLKLSLDHLDKGLAAYDPEQYGARRYRLGNNPGVVCNNASALVLWMLGFPDRALRRANEAVALSQRLKHPSSMAYALFHTGLLYLWMRQPEPARDCAQVALDVAEEHEFPAWSAVASCLRGAALAGMGSEEEGLAVIQQAIDTYRELRTPPVFWPILLSLKAGAYGLVGRPADGLTLIDESISIMNQQSTKTLSSAFHDLKGDLLLAQSPDNLAEAEFSYQHALQLALDVQAPMLELRAALKLSRLWRNQGKPEPARQVLHDAYAKFTEGFSLPDLTEAKALLDELSGNSLPT